MAGSFVGRVLLIAGVVFFLYTAYAAMSHRERLRLLQREFDGLPSALFSNLVLSSGVLLVAGLKLWGNFAPIRVAENPRCVCRRSTGPSRAGIARRSRIARRRPRG